MNAELKNFGRNLRVIRMSLGYTRTELAKKLGVSTATIANYEAGRRMPSLDTVSKIAGILDVTMNMLVNGC